VQGGIRVDMGRIFKEIIEQSKGFFVTATSTDIGKTFFSSILLKYTKGVYFKPIQTGEKDRDIVKENTCLDESHFIEEKYHFKEPVSPHYAAEKANVNIDLNRINLPDSLDKKIVVEGAGGVFAPIGKKLYMIDIIKRISLPTIVVAEDTLGTINHTLLTLNSLVAYNCKVSFIVLNRYNPESYNYTAICEITQLPVLRIPVMQKFPSDEEIRRVFDEQI
jgi:dethiobiotin synthetase